MGRPIKSTEDHIKDGTYRKDRYANRGVTLDALKNVPVPSDLNESAKAKWAEIIPSLENAGLITIVDLPELTDAFLHYGFAQECLKKVFEEYSSVADYLAELNKFKAVDLVAKYTEYMDYFNRIMHKFGTTPEARAKIKVKPKEENPNDFLKSLMGNG